jgi:hypothetical protein
MTAASPHITAKHLSTKATVRSGSYVSTATYRPVPKKPINSPWSSGTIGRTSAGTRWPVLLTIGDQVDSSAGLGPRKANRKRNEVRPTKTLLARTSTNGLSRFLAAEESLPKCTPREWRTTTTFGAMGLIDWDRSSRRDDARTRDAERRVTRRVVIKLQVRELGRGPDSRQTSKYSVIARQNRTPF